MISSSKGDLEANSCAPDCVLPDLEIKLNSLKAKLKFLPQLVTFITPLVFVFIFEYICVSGLVSNANAYQKVFISYGG